MKKFSFVFFLAVIALELADCGHEKTTTSCDVCTLQKVWGPCRDYMLRFYYDQNSKECQSFYYGGCDGNGNNFETVRECETACKTIKHEGNDGEEPRKKEPESTSSNEPTESYVPEGDLEEKCQVGPWGAWSGCEDAPCVDNKRNGWQTRFRSVGNDGEEECFGIDTSNTLPCDGPCEETTAANISNFGIIGGTPIKITDAPFMALLIHMFQRYCGASIVHERFVITAGHCSTKRISELTVTVGTDNALEGGEDYSVTDMFVHPKYSPQTRDYDIAVVKIKGTFVWSDRVKPIPMADSSPKDGAIIDTMGFGRKEDKKFSGILLDVKLPVFNHEQCNKQYMSKRTVTERMICAGGEEGKDSCKYDSGGPLRYNGQLLGVVSWGNAQCGQAGYPGVYSYLPSMRDFIDGTIKNNS